MGVAEGDTDALYAAGIALKLDVGAQCLERARASAEGNRY